MGHNRRKKKASPQKSTLSPHTRGCVLLALSLSGLLGIASFVWGTDNPNWLAQLGYAIGWLFVALFGVLSYPLCLFTGYLGWQLLLRGEIPHLWRTLFWTGSFLASAAILLALFEVEFPELATHLNQRFYPAPWENRLHLHLGGALFYFFYLDFPNYNLAESAGPLLTFIATSGLLIASLIALMGKQLEAFSAQLALFFQRTAPRLVKLKMAQQPAAGSSQPEEMLTIQPSANPTVRPSVSIKNGLDIKIPTPKTISKKEAAILAQRVSNGDFSGYCLPSPALISHAKKVDQTSLKKDLKHQAEVLEETLMSFGIEAKVGQINCGPTITSFEVHPAIGVKVQKIKSLENDIALNLEAKSIRILAPIPGKAAIGIEVPNPKPQEVGFREMLMAYQQNGEKLRIPVLLGKTVNGDYVMTDLVKMPHCIIAGATGSGKSVCINTIVMSILMNAKPDEIKLLMVDPKKVELTPYTRLPHMLAPVITEPLGACTAMQWLVKEMENRYEILKLVGVRNIDGFNSRTIDKEFEASLDRQIPEKLHYIVGIIDELADLMMVSGNEIETYIARIAQMARAVGIHLILATQRPSREVITGLIKANFPTRIAFKVASRVNSQIILDEVGAEQLLGNGDMLFLPPGSSLLTRAQGVFVRDRDIQNVVEFICNQAPPSYAIQSFDHLEADLHSAEEDKEEKSDPLYEQALKIVQETGMASTTFLQRKLKIGYARAASLMDELEEGGVVGPAEGSKPRKILAKEEDDL